MLYGIGQNRGVTVGNLFWVFNDLYLIANSRLELTLSSLYHGRWSWLWFFNSLHVQPNSKSQLSDLAI